MTSDGSLISVWVDVDSVFLSLRVGLISAAIVAVVGAFLARLIAHSRTTAGRLARTAGLLPLALPPSVLGLILVWFLASNGPIGSGLESIGGRAPLFRAEGIVIALVISSLPLALQPMIVAFAGVSTGVVEAARLCGAGRWATLWHIEIPLAARGIASGAAVAFAHAVGAFGAVLIVGGDVPRETRTASVAVFNAAQGFDTRQAWGTGIMVVVLAAACLFLVLCLEQRQESNGDE